MSQKRARTVSLSLTAPQPSKAKRSRTRTAPKKIGSRSGINRWQKASLRYVKEITLDAPPGGSAVQVFCSNGLYDPDITFGGLQPMGYDQWMALYKTYHVTGSRIQMRSTNPDGANTDSAYYGIKRGDEPTELLGYSVHEILEKSQMSDIGIAGVFTTDGSKSTRAVFNNYSHARAKNSSVFQDQNSAGSFTTNPASRNFYHCFAASMSGNDPAAQTFLITIDYDVIFSEPKSIIGS